MHAITLSMWLPVNDSHTVVIKMTFLPCRYGLLQGGISSIYKNVMELGKKPGAMPADGLCRPISMLWRKEAATDCSLCLS